MLGKRVHQCDKEKVAERHLEQDPDPNGGRTETENASSRSHSVGKEGCLSVIGHICLPVHNWNSGTTRWSLQAAIRGWGDTPSSHVTYLTWQQIQQRSARDFWKQALCRLHAMFMCNQTKVNGENSPLQYNKTGFYHSHTLRVYGHHIHTPYDSTQYKFSLCNVKSCTKLSHCS